MDVNDPMTELTTADGFELESATHHKRGDVTNDVSIDRWQNYGKDRLYLNGLKTGDGWISLRTGESGGDKWTKVSAECELEGDELTIEVGNNKTIYTLVVRVIGEDFEPVEDDSDDSEPELVADGGEDVTAHVDDSTIEDAIEDQDGPLEDDRTATVAEVRDAFAWVQQSVTEYWGEWLDNLEHGECHVVHEDDEVIVLETGEQSVPRRDLREHYDGELGERVPQIVNAIHHELARDRCDYDWSVTYPLVVAKPDGFAAGQGYVEAVVNGLQREGLTPGQVWSYYGVEIRGNSQSAWARRTDRDQSTVSEQLSAARRHGL